MLNPDEIKRLLDLQPHPAEGGFFVETYRSATSLPGDAFTPPYRGDRSASTAIYYLLTPDSVSLMHRLPGDEIFHFYLGDPVQMLHLHPRGRVERPILGTDLAQGMRPQITVPGGVWQGAKLIEGGRCALIGTTMAPGFDLNDYEPGDREELVREWPAAREGIEALTLEG